MEDFKIVIAGSRTFDDYDLLVKICDYYLQNVKDTMNIIVVSGKAKGADELGEKYAKERGYKVESRPANWDKYGKSAGYIRNEEMAKISNALIAFWDGKSRGTNHMINLARKYKLKVVVKIF